MCGDGVCVKGEDGVWCVVVGVEIEGLDDDDYWFNLKMLWWFMGLGFLMCIAYVDSGNFESDL